MELDWIKFEYEKTILPGHYFVTNGNQVELCWYDGEDFKDFFNNYYTNKVKYYADFDWPKVLRDGT